MPVKTAQPRGDPAFVRIRGLLAQTPDPAYRKGMGEMLDHLEVRRAEAEASGSLTEVQRIDFLILEDERTLLQQLREYRRDANENRRANLRLVLQIIPTIVVFLAGYF